VSGRNRAHGNHTLASGMPPAGRRQFSTMRARRRPRCTKAQAPRAAPACAAGHDAPDPIHGPWAQTNGPRSREGNPVTRSGL
jgi:hypothetical protein